MGARGSTVTRKVVLFFAALLLALTAGRAFWVELGENPFNVSGPAYVEFFQQVDKRIAGPIAVTGLGGTLLAGLAAFLSRANRAAFWLLLLGCSLAVIGDVVTVVVNVPINNRLATWNPAALPADYQDYLQRWWQWHHVRLVATCAAMCLVFAAMLTAEDRRR
jgi:uncharacterized membrane protein